MRILAVGDNNVDTYASGYSYAGGNCINVAAYAAMNGWDSAYLGVVGKDDFGGLQVRALKKAQVNTEMIRKREGKTSRDIIVSQNGDRVFTCYDRSIIDANPVYLSSNELLYAKQSDLIHSSIYSVFADNELERLCALGVPVSYDFSVEWKPGESQVADDNSMIAALQHNTMERICPMLTFAFFSCGSVTLEETKEVLKKAVDLGSKIAVGTRGMDGAWCYDGNRFYYQMAYPAQVIDTLGAGDSFITRFLLSYTEKMHWMNTILLAVQHSISSNELGDYKEKAIQAALADAALFAARTCSLEGAFGFGEII